MKTILIIPTYNERENISQMLPELLSTYPEINILVVDDNSPDGTGGWVEELSLKDDRVFILKNPGKGGLGKAYLQGFAWGLERGYEGFAQMDADFSHRIVDLQKLLKGIESEGLIIGSRYVENGGTVNWAWYRKLISRFGSLYARLILGFPVADWTGGFNAWRAETLQKIPLSDVRSEGYSFQIEMKYRAMKMGVKAGERPIIFEERREGQSKMSLKIVLEAFYRVWQIRFIV